MWPFKKKPKPSKQKTVKDPLLRALSAASLKGKFGDWRPQYETLLGELQQGNLRLIRKRCRESSVNSPVIASLISEIESMVIGKGLQVEFRHSTARHAEEANRLWEEWTQKKTFSSDEEMDFYQMQCLMMNEISTVGEVFLKKNLDDDGPGEGIPINYQMLPPDQLSDDVSIGYSITENIPKEVKEKATFINGIAYNKKGKKIGYIFFDDDYAGNALYTYPFIARSNRKFVPADQIHHIFNRKEIRYRRGWPLIGTPIVYAHLVKLLDESQLSKQIIAAMFAAFIHDNSAEFSLEQEKTDTEGEEGDDGFDYDAELQSGTMYKLDTGKDVKFTNAPESRDYSDFDKAILRKIAASSGVAYESLAANHSDANYSAARQAQLNSNRRLDTIRENVIVKQFIVPVIDDFKAYLKTMAILPTEKLEYDIYRPGKVIIDPAKEIRPKTQEVKSGFRSWSETVRERGMNPRKVAEKIKEDYELFDSLGLKLDTDNRHQIQESSNGEDQTETNTGGVD